MAVIGKGTETYLLLTGIQTGNCWGVPFTERMIEFARGHRGVKRVLGDLVAGEQGYVDLKKKLLRSAFRPV